MDRRVHVRVRRAARRTTGGSAVARPRPAPRSHGRRGAARAHRSGRARRPRARPAAPHSEPPGAQRRRGARPAASARRPVARRDRGTVRARRRRAARASTSSSRHGGRSQSVSVPPTGSRTRTTRDGCETGSAPRSRSVFPRCAPRRQSTLSKTWSRATPRRTGRSLLQHPRPGSARPSSASWAALAALETDGRVVHGEFRPDGVEREWCDVDVLRQLRRRSLASLRREVEPVEPDAYARFALAWHGIHTGSAPRRRRSGRSARAAAGRTDRRVGARDRRTRVAAARVLAGTPRRALHLRRCRVGRGWSDRRCRRSRSPVLPRSGTAPAGVDRSGRPAFGSHPRRSP